MTSVLCGAHPTKATKRTASQICNHGDSSSTLLEYVQSQASASQISKFWDLAGTRSVFGPHGRAHHGMSFLDLPPEIRNMIYGNCRHCRGENEILTRSDMIPEVRLDAHSITSSLSTERFDDGFLSTRVILPSTQAIALLRVSKQIHKEAAAGFYGGNTFCFVFGLNVINNHNTYAGNCESHSCVITGLFECAEVRENPTTLSPPYMKMIRKCGLVLFYPCGSWLGGRESFLRYKGHIVDFAASFNGMITPSRNFA